MKRRVHKWVGAMLATLSVSSAIAQPPDEGFYVEAADCTAALKARVLEREALAPSDARNHELVEDTALGFAFVGVAYKKGLRNPEADHLLQEAEARWKTLAHAEQIKRQQVCTAKGRQLMDDLSAVEEFLVRNRAQARVNKWLEKESAK